MKRKITEYIGSYPTYDFEKETFEEFSEEFKKKFTRLNEDGIFFDFKVVLEEYEGNCSPDYEFYGIRYETDEECEERLKYEREVEERKKQLETRMSKEQTQNKEKKLLQAKKLLEQSGYKITKTRKKKK